MNQLSGLALLAALFTSGHAAEAPLCNDYVWEGCCDRQEGEWLIYCGNTPCDMQVVLEASGYVEYEDSASYGWSGSVACSTVSNACQLKLPYCDGTQCRHYEDTYGFPCDFCTEPGAKNCGAA